MVTRAAYVAISRAREGATIHTDSRTDLTKALGIRKDAQVGAIDETMTRQKAATIAITAPGKDAGMGLTFSSSPSGKSILPIDL